MRKAIKDQHSASTHSKLQIIIAVVAIVNLLLQYLLPRHVLPLTSKHREYNCVEIMVVVIAPLYRTDVPV